MSTITLTCPKIIHVRRVLAIGLIAISILTSLALIAGAISDIASSTTWEGFQADRIPVARNLIVPISVATPPPPDTQPIASETVIPTFLATDDTSIGPIPVPTAPF